MSSNLIRRIVVAAIAIPTAIAVVYVGGWALTGLLAVFAALGSAELYRLADRKGMRPIEDLGYVAAADGVRRMAQGTGRWSDLGSSYYYLRSDLCRRDAGFPDTPASPAGSPLCLGCNLVGFPTADRGLDL